MFRRRSRSPADTKDPDTNLQTCGDWRLLDAGHLFQLARLRTRALDGPARIATLGKRETFTVQLEFVVPEQSAQKSSTRFRVRNLK